jgi:hypothetical protein
MQLPKYLPLLYILSLDIDSTTSSAPNSEINNVLMNFNYFRTTVISNIDTPRQQEILSYKIVCLR